MRRSHVKGRSTLPSEGWEKRPERNFLEHFSSAPHVLFYALRERNRTGKNARRRRQREGGRRAGLLKSALVAGAVASIVHNTLVASAGVHALTMLCEARSAAKRAVRPRLDRHGVMDAIAYSLSENEFRRSYRMDFVRRSSYSRGTCVPTLKALRTGVTTLSQRTSPSQ